MSSHEWLVGAGVGLALAALLYLFYYMTYTDQTVQQSGTDTSGGRVSRNRPRGEVETAMSNNEQSGTPDNITTAYTTGGYVFTDSTLKRHNDRAYGPAGHLSAHAGPVETSAATAAARTHNEATTAAKPDAARTVAPAAAAAATAAHHTPHKADGHKTVETHVRAETTAKKSTTAGHRADDTRDRGTPWLGWAAGIGAVLAAAGLLAFNQKGDAVKQAAKAQVEDVKTAVAEKVIPKVEAAVEAVKEKVAEVKAAIPEKAVIAVVVPKAEVKTEVKAEAKPEVTEAAKAEPEPEPEPEAKPEAVAAAAPAAAPAAPVSGVTNFYGAGDGSQVMAWSADAVQNPDYAEAEAAAPAEPEAQPADAEAPAAEEPAPAVEAAAVPAAEEAPAAPVAKVEPGVTSYYGDGQTPDAGQPWAAEAEMNPDYAVADAAAPEAAAEPEPVAVAEAVPGVTSTYESSTWTAPENYYAPADPEPAAAVAAAEPEPVAAPVAEPVPGVTSAYESSTWTAPENYYAPVEPEPAPVAAVPEPEPAKTEPGVTSAYASSTWAAPANYYAPVDTCSTEVAAALKSGKLNFATSSWEILDDSYSTLDKIAKLIKGCNGASVEVGGHTDNTGTASGNQVLSEQRAKAVVKYLTGAGVSAGQLKAVGYGQDKPIADNTTTAGKRDNRRIEFVVAGK
jgi:outer membrane protein OmpA-like peptidoglycan-associated protein